MRPQLDDFGRYVLAEEIVAPAALEDCLAAQDKMREVGIEKSLAEVIVDKGLLDRKEVRRLVAKMKGGDEDFIPGYRILKKLGDGAMGRVYMAVQISTERTVALKVLYPRFVREERFTKMFQRESQAALQLSHKNLVRGYDAGVVKERYFYYAMEYVEGTNLRKRYLTLREKASEYDCLTILFQMGQALEYAHQFKFVHRDVKPDNIIITAEGIIKLCDLGLMKQVDDPLSMTATGLVVGTPYYISPEQGRGKKDLDTRSDMYSLGATIYHIATLKVPFDGDEPLVVIERHIREDVVPPHERRPELTRGFSYVICRMMEKDRDNRYPDPSALQAAGARGMRGKDPSPEIFRSWSGRGDDGGKEPPPAKKKRSGRGTASGSRSRSRGPRAALMVLAGLGLLGVGSVAWTLSGDGEKPVQAQVSVETFDPTPATPIQPPVDSVGPVAPVPDPDPPVPDPGTVVRDPPRQDPPVVRVPDPPPVRRGGDQERAALLSAATDALQSRGIEVRTDGSRQIELDPGLPGSADELERLDGDGAPTPAAIDPAGLSLGPGPIRARMALSGRALVAVGLALERPDGEEPVEIRFLLLPHLVALRLHPDGRAEGSLRYRGGYARMPGQPDEPGPYGLYTRPIDAPAVALGAFPTRADVELERGEGGEISLRCGGVEVAFWIPDVRGEDPRDWTDDSYFPLLFAPGGSVRLTRVRITGDPLDRWLEGLTGAR